MKTPRERYNHDPHFHQLVDLLESFIERAEFTPSELREAAILAAINHEYRHAHRNRIIPEVQHALGVLERSFVLRKRSEYVRG